MMATRTVEKFAKLANADMACQDTTYVSMMHLAVAQYQHEIGNAQIGRLAEAHAQCGCVQEGFQRMNARLYYVLVSLADKGAFAIVGQVKNNSGMAALRRLRGRYAKTRRQTSAAALVAVMGMQRPDDNTLGG